MTDTDRIDALLRGLEPGIRHNLATHGHLCPILFLDARVDPVTNEKRRTFQIISATGMMHSDASKDALDTFVRDAIRRYDCVLVGLLMEIWHAPYDGTDTRPADRPDRREAVQFRFETPDETRVYQAAITRDAEERPCLGAFKLAPGTHVGRFCHLFPKDVGC